jgi:tRNA G18 (ribose-2'-O)-methylase SpoU
VTNLARTMEKLKAAGVWLVGTSDHAHSKSIDELEEAIKAGKPEDAKKVFEKLSEQKEKGHKDFAPDE